MSKCPFTSLVGKLWPWGGGGSDDGALPPGVCPLGFGSRPAGASGGAKCPLGFGSSSKGSAGASSTTVTSLPAMTLAELQASAAGIGEGRSLVSVKGIVFDVAGRAAEFAPLLGHDASRFLALGGGGAGAGAGAGAGGDAVVAAAAVPAALAPVDAASVLDQGLDGLAYDEVVRLERVLEALFATFPPVAVLAEADKQALFPPSMSAAAIGEGASAAATNDVAAAAAQLHEMIQEGAPAAAIGELLAACPAAANAPCPRTGMSPLHKAIEAAAPDAEDDSSSSDAVETIKVLLAHGADRAAKAALYDGDTPLQLARRFRRSEAVQLLLG